jgi:protein subunit release factor A
MTLYNLENFINGDIQSVIDGLSTHFQAAALKQSAA